VWHVSVSVASDGRNPQFLQRPDVCEREAIALLAGVGGDTEWWIYNRSAAIGHLRVPVTEIEFDQCPAGMAIADAGPSGERRPRTYPKGRGKRSGAS
jgi:hypothetical protein